MSEYIAKTRICAPGTMQGAYNPGDPVSAYTVDQWGLTDDEVELDTGASTDVPRPADDDVNRRAWERYVISQGAAREQAEAASLDELRGMYEPPEAPAWQQNDAAAGANQPADDGGEGEVRRPAESAKKADWVKYVVGAGADEPWASDPATTKDDLIAWEPPANG